MKKLIPILILLPSIALASWYQPWTWFGSEPQNLGLSTFLTVQGGTATSSPSGILYGSGSANPLKTVTMGSNCTFSAGVLNCPAGAGTYSFTPTLISGIVYSATSSPVVFINQLVSSSTIGQIVSGSITATSTLILTGAGTGCATFTNGVLTGTGAACGSGSGANPFTSNVSWGALVQATSSRLAFPEELVASSTIGRLTAGSITATSSVSFPTGSISDAMLASTFLKVVTADSPLSGSGTSASHLVIAASAHGTTGTITGAENDLLHSATSTFSSPLSYSFSTNAVTCPTCLTSMTFAYPFTPTLLSGIVYSATSSPVAFVNELVSSSTTGRLTVGDFTSTSTATFKAGSIATAALVSNTISGIALGSNLNALTNDTTLVGTSYNGSAAVSDWGIDLSNANTWTGVQTFGNATSTTMLGGKLSYFSSTTIGNLTTGLITSTSTATSTFSGGIATAGLSSTNGLVISGGSAYFAGSGIWNSSGNVGIGTTGPNAPLEIKTTGTGFGSGLRLTASGSTHYWDAIIGGSDILYLGYDGSTKFSVDTDGGGYFSTLRIHPYDLVNTIWSGANNIGITADTGHKIFLSQTSNSATGLTVDTTTGNVGIGTTNPLQLLQVGDGTQVTPEIKIAGETANNAGEDITADIRIGTQTWGNVNDTDNIAWKLARTRLTNDYDGRFSIYSVNRSGTSEVDTERLSILVNGNVGIGRPNA